MTRVLPLVQKAWERRRNSSWAMNWVSYHVIKGHCVDGTCLLLDTFFPSHDTSVWVPVWSLHGKRIRTGAVLEVLQPVGTTCVGEVNEGL